MPFGRAIPLPGTSVQRLLAFLLWRFHDIYQMNPASQILCNSSYKNKLQFTLSSRSILKVNGSSEKICRSSLATWTLAGAWSWAQQSSKWVPTAPFHQIQASWDHLLRSTFWTRFSQLQPAGLLGQIPTFSLLAIHGTGNVLSGASCESL